MIFMRLSDFLIMVQVEVLCVTRPSRDFEHFLNIVSVWLRQIRGRVAISLVEAGWLYCQTASVGLSLLLLPRPETPHLGVVAGSWGVGERSSDMDNEGLLGPFSLGTNMR